MRPRTSIIFVPAVGAAGSVILTLFAGRHNNSRLLMGLFAIWVLIPFVVLAWVNRSRKLNVASFILTAATLIVYANAAFYPPEHRGAFAFVVVPPATLAVTAIAAALTKKR